MIYVEVIGDAVFLLDKNDVRRTPNIQNRWDWETFEVADLIADKLNESTDGFYIPTDSGPNVSPRYDVILAPKVGDEVSYSFNGDTYPCGKIKSISASLRLIITDEGRKFYRRKLTGAWCDKGWTLIPGHIHEQNPHF